MISGYCYIDKKGRQQKQVYPIPRLYDNGNLCVEFLYTDVVTKELRSLLTVTMDVPHKLPYLHAAVNFADQGLIDFMVCNYIATPADYDITGTFEKVRYPVYVFDEVSLKKGFPDMFHAYREWNMLHGCLGRVNLQERC